VEGMDARPFFEEKCEVFVENRQRKLAGSKFPENN
jgi:hypothetical protein